MRSQWLSRQCPQKESFKCFKEEKQHSAALKHEYKASLTSHWWRRSISDARRLFSWMKHKEGTVWKLHTNNTNHKSEIIADYRLSNHLLCALRASDNHLSDQTKSEHTSVPNRPSGGRLPALIWLLNLCSFQVVTYASRRAASLDY